MRAMQAVLLLGPPLNSLSSRGTACLEIRSSSQRIAVRAELDYLIKLSSAWLELTRTCSAGLGSARKLTKIEIKMFLRLGLEERKY